MRARIAGLLGRLVRLVLILALLPLLIDLPAGTATTRSALIPTAAAPAARVITVSGLETVVAEAGDAADPALVLVHGFGGSTFGWRSVMEPLAAQGWHVVALDLPGFGLSEKTWSRSYAHEDQARFVLATMDALHIEHAVVVGHSMGGNVVAWMRELAPARIDGVALIDAAIVEPGAASGAPGAGASTATILAVPQVRRIGRIALRSLFSDALFGELLSSAFAVKSVATPTTIAGYAASSHLENWDLALLGIVRDGAANALPRPISAILGDAGGGVDVPPMLILWGAEDSWVPLDRGAALHAALPQADYVVLPGLGHVPFEEDPAGFVTALGDWLAAR